jgi:hypothetical protein
MKAASRQPPRLVPALSENQVCFFQFVDQFRVPLGKESESPGSIRLQAGDFQNNCG